MSGFGLYKQASTQDELAAGFLQELATFEPAVEPEPELTTAAVVQLIVKCAEELEAAQLDTGVADEALGFIETELL